MIKAGQGEDYQVPGMVRSYRDVAALVGCTLSPSVQVKELVEGQWLLHTTMAGLPHCMGLLIAADGTVHVHNGGTCYKTTLNKLQGMIVSSIDKNYMVFFKINNTEDPVESLLPLLDLQAGVSVAIFDCDMDELNKDMPDLEQVDLDGDTDESNVNVEKVLMETLDAEVKGIISTIDSKAGWKDFRGNRNTIVCPFCPFREFRNLKHQGTKQLLRHFREFHGGKETDTLTGKDYVASGSKQYNVIRALYDQQVQAHITPAGLLEQSASLMRSWLEDSRMIPDGMDTEFLIDRKLVLCLTGEGPKYLSAERTRTSGFYRSVGYNWYDKDFATIFFSEMVRCHGKAKTLATNLIHLFLSRGCLVVFLLPRKATTVYLKIMEDIMNSPTVTSWHQKLLRDCLEHREFVHISMDATVRMAMRLKGQGNYREPKEVRNSYLVGDSEAKRRILTLRGRTGAVLAMSPIKSESCKDIKDFLLDAISSDVRAQVEYLASDQPSGALFGELSDALPSLRAVYLDEVHLCIVWQVAFWRKSSPGQQALRRVQAKFNRVDPSTPIGQWGFLFTGKEDVSYTQAEEDMRNLIMSGAMSLQRAACVLNQLEDDKPWYCKLDYIRALAALAAAFPQEMTRKTYVQGRTIGHILWCAAAPDKVAWQWNAMIVRRSLPQSWMTLLPAGTTSNESLHAELNRWWKNSPEQFATTLQLHLSVGHMGKLLAHNAALYSPTLRQVGHDQVLALALRAVQFTEPDWLNWCLDGVRADLPLFRAREDLSGRLVEQGISERQRTKTQYVVLKKPAGTTVVRKKPAGLQVRKKPAGVQVKNLRGKLRRTPFTLKRSF